MPRKDYKKLYEDMIQKYEPKTPKDARIIYILDRSGSMTGLEADVVGGYNGFIESQKKEPGKATLTFVQFDNVIETVFEDVDIQDVKDMRKNSFVPRGTTSLYDAIGTTLVGLTDLPSVKTIVVIMTDGHENSSKEYTQTGIRNMIDNRTAVCWDFIYLGANQDAFAVGGSLGIDAGSTYSWEASKVGTRTAYANTMSAVSQSRGNNPATP